MVLCLFFWLNDGVAIELEIYGFYIMESSACENVIDFDVLVECKCII